VAPASLVSNQVELNGGTLNFSSDVTGLTLTSFTSGSSSTITTLSATGVTAAALKASNGILALTGGTGGNIGAGTVTLTIAPPDMPGGVQATAVANVTLLNGTNQITSYTITNPGSGYGVAPAMYLTTTAGTLPSANPTVGYYSFTGSTSIESEGIVTGPVALSFANLGTSVASGTATTSLSATLAATRGVQLDAAGGDLDVANSATGFVGTVAGPVTGSGALTKTGSGVLILSNTTNSWSGGTYVNGGVLDMTTTNEVPNYATALGVNAGGILGFAYGGPNDFTSTQIATLLSGTMFATNSGFGLDTTNLSGTYGNNIGGSLSFAKLGTNTLTLTGSNSYTGSTFIDGGILSLGSSNALGSTSVITFNGGQLQGSLQYSGSNTTDYSSIIKNSLGAISIDTNGQTVTFGSSLASSNVGGLTKSGSGQLNLNVSNPYTGPNVINAGTVQLGNANALGSNSANYPMTIASAGTLDMHGNSINVGPLSGNGSITSTGTLGAVILSVYPGVGMTSTFGGGILVQSSSANSQLSVAVNNGTEAFAGNSNFSTLYPNGGNIIVTGTATVTGINYNTHNTITVNGGYLNDAGGYINIPGTLTLTSGTIYMPGYVEGSGTLNLNGGVFDSSWLGNFNNLSPALTINFNGGTLFDGGSHGNGGQLQELLGNGYYGGAEETVTTGSNGASVNTNGDPVPSFDVSVRPIQNAAGQVGTFTKLGAGALNVSNTNSYTGLTTVSAGTLVFDYSLWGTSTNSTLAPVLPAGAPVAIANGATLSFKGNPNAVSGTSTFTIANSGQDQYVSGGNTTGLVVGEPVSGAGIPANDFIAQIYGGTAFILNTPPTGSGAEALTFGGATFNAINQSLSSVNLTSGTGILNVNVNGATGMTVTVTGSVSGPGALEETGNGLLVLQGSNSYSGGTVLGGGTLNYTNAYGLGTSGTVTYVANSDLQAGVSSTISAIGSTSGVTGTFDTQGNAQSLGSLSGAGNLVLLNSGTVSITGSGSETGNVALNGGVVTLSSTYALPTASGNISFGGGTLQFSSSNAADYSSRIASSGSAITIDTNGQNVTFASALAASNTGGLTKVGLGLLALNGANAFTGPITITSGTLQTGNGSALGSASGNYALTINTGATLDLHGYGYNIGPLSGNGNIVDPGTVVGASVLTMYVGASVTSTFGGSILQTGSAITMDVSSGTEVFTGNSNLSNLQATGGSVVIGSGAVITGLGNAGTTAGSTGSFVVNGGSVTSGNLQVTNGNVIVNSGTLTQNATFVIGGNGYSLNLNGGVLAANWISTFGQNGNFTLNFNGGTLRASGVSGNSGQAGELIADGDFARPELTVTTSSNGAFIDTNGFNENSIRPIQNASGQVGFLTKLGLGTLNLSNTNSYTGLTTVSAGTLAINYARYSPDQNATPDSFLASGANLSIAGNATFSVIGRPNASGTTETVTLLSNQAEFENGVTAGLTAGESITGAQIPAGTFINEIYGGGNFAISASPTGSQVTETATFGAITYNPVNQIIGSVALTSGTGTINLNVNGGSGVSMTVNGGITGSGALQETGNGLLTLNGSGSYTGGTIIAGGTLQVGNTYALGATTGNLTINAGSTLDLNGSNLITGMLNGPSGAVITSSSNGASASITTAGSGNGTYSGVIQNGNGTVGLTMASSGTQTLASTNSYSGPTNINAGVLALSVSGALSANTNITFGGGTLKYIGNTTDYSSQIVNSGSAVSIDTGNVAPEFYTALAASNSGGLTVLSSSGNGTLTVIGAQVYTGLTTITSGGLYLGDNTGGDDVTSMATGGILDNGLLEFKNASTETNTIPISGTGIVEMNGNGTEIFSGSNSYSGGTLVNSGVLNYTNVNALGTGNVTFSGPGTLQAGVSGTLANIGVNTNVSGIFDTQGNAVTLSGGLTGAGTLAKVGSGTLTISGSSNDTGDLSINAGVVALAGTNALPTTTGTITFDGGTLQFSALNAGDYSSRIANSGSAISLDTNGQNVTFASALAASNIGGLTKNGLGRLTLNSADGYTGGTTITSGTLQLGNAAALNNNSNFLAVNGGTLDLHGNTVSVGPLTGGGTIMNNGAIGPVTLNVYPGASVTSTFGGSILQTGSTISLYVANGTEVFTGNSTLQNLYGQTGTVVIAGGADTVLSGIGGLGGSFIVNGGSISATIIGASSAGSFTITSGTASASLYVNGGSGGVINLNGGVLLADWVSAFQASGGVTLAFNGGTLRANGNSGNGGQAAEFVGNGAGGQAEMIVTTGSNGAYIDTNGYNEALVRPIKNAPGQVGFLTKLGAGTLTMSNTSSYTGLTTVSAGTLAIDYSKFANDQNVTPDSILASGANVSIAGGATFSVRGRLNATASTGTSTMLYPGNVSELVTIASTSNLVAGESVSGPGIPAGAFITEIYGGSAFLINTPATSATTALLTFGGETSNPVNQSLGSLNLSSGTGTMDVEVNGGSGVTVTVANGVTGPGTLQETGNGLLVLSGSGSYSGGTVVTGGTLQLGNTYALGATTGNLAVNGGTVDLNGNSPTVGALSGNSGSVITTTAGTAILTASSASTSTYAGTITDGAGQVGLTQAGTGTLKLTANNTYTGATAVNAGTLIVSGSLSGTGSASVASGGTLEVDGLLNHAATTTLNGGTLQGTGSVGGITDNGSSTVAPGLTAANSAISTGTMTANGPVTLAATTNFNIRLGFTSGTTGDQLAVNSGNVSLNDANLNLTLGSAMNNPALINTFYAIIVGGAGSTGSGSDVFGSYNGTAIVGNTFITSGGWQFDVLYAENATGTGGGNDVVLELTAIPEPGTWATMLSGFGMLLFVQRIRRKARR
jgi:autotransporter-associated beta strand protein